MESMGMPNDPQPAAYARKGGLQLQRVAQALEVPVEAFFGVAPIRSDTADAAELLRLWQAIRDPENRQSLLLAARGFVEREADARLAAE
jgi:hypothetical protein